ncbi:MAG TPA: AraC family transcriptional regulator [Rhodopila sp.]
MQVETLASGAGWCIQDIRCSAGPRDRPFEEQHQSVCVAAVLGGSFQYRTAQGAGQRGAATLAPGAILLGNHGQCYECGHEHVQGDRCLSFLFDPGDFETILSATPGAQSATLPLTHLPPLMQLTPVIAAAELARAEGDPGRLEEAGLELAGKVAGLLAGNGRPRAAPTSRDTRRIASVLRRIESEAHDRLSLAELARDAAMSRYHFLRIFRDVVGLTPHQFILRTRLHNAAIALHRSARPILDIALDAGFADLSTFNRRFRATMGTTPSRYRRRH